jgi:hypothetical protein
LKKCTALILLGSSWLRIIWTQKGISAVPDQNIVFHDLLKQIPWAKFDLLVEQHNADWDGRVVKTKAHLIALLYAHWAAYAVCARSKRC